MSKRLMTGTVFTILVTLVLGLFVYSPAEAGRVPLPGGWEVEIVYCTDGFYATAITPTDRDGFDANRHTVILTDITPAATNVGPIADFTWNDGFPTVTSYFRWETPQTAGTPVNATLDRLQNGVSVTEAEGRVDSDVVQECQLPLLTDSQPGTPITFGEPQLGQVGDATGTYYSFDGSAGDIVAFEALGVGGISPTVTLIGSGAELLHSVNGNGSSNLSFSTTLPATGTYVILMGETNGVAGQFTLNLAQGSAPAMALVNPSQTQGTLNPTSSTMTYDLATNPVGTTRLEVQSLTDGFSPVVTVATQSGEIVANITNVRVAGVALDLAGGGETLQVTVGLGAFAGEASYLVTVGDASVVAVPSTDATPPSSDTDVPDATEEPPAVSACSITSNHDTVNVRSGGSTNHPVVGQLSSTENVPATGFNAANQGWYEVTLTNGTVGWISSTVTTSTGDCSILPIKNYPAAPVPPTSAPPPTTAPSGGGDNNPPPGTPEA